MNEFDFKIVLVIALTAVSLVVVSQLSHLAHIRVKQLPLKNFEKLKAADCFDSQLNFKPSTKCITISEEL